MKYIGKSVKKIDADALLSGKPVYTDDLAPKNALIVKLLRSPYPFAKIVSIDKSIAEKVPGIECIVTHEDVPKYRFTTAGQTFPEMSPYDRYILEDVVRYVGDPVAIVAGDTDEIVDKAMKMIKVKYEKYEPIVDFREAIDHKSIIHDEDDYHLNVPIGNEVKRNICSAGEEGYGDFEKEFADSPVKQEGKYFMQAQAQAPMENFTTYTYFDYTGRITIVSSTQVPFHVRRITARALGIKQSKLRVVKPRIGGGFGAKQTQVSEVYPAYITYITQKPAKIVYSRYESFSCSNSRHAMEIEVKIGGDEQGNLNAISVNTLSNTGAYGEHGCTTVGLSGHKTLPLYNNAKSAFFKYNVVYTNIMPAAAFRGYGATQGFFAVESAINEYVHKIGVDPLEFRLNNIPKVGDVMRMYYGETLTSSALEECLKLGAKEIGWYDEPLRKVMPDGRVQGMGMAMCMQGSGIPFCDSGSVEIRLNDDGFYNLMVGSTDMGTGSDTILSQMAAEILQVDIEQIVISGVDTDVSPFDPGSYASSTTYVTGMSVVKAAENMVEKLKNVAAKRFETTVDNIIFDGNKLCFGNEELTLDSIAQSSIVGAFEEQLVSVATHGGTTSPPPLMAGFAKVLVCLKTGKVEVVDFVGCVDCGTPINENLARIQVEGGLVQGIGLALYEDVVYTNQGRMVTDSFMQYKVPTRLDTGKVRAFLTPSYEDSGPFGAKSIGEVVINTPSPAIAHAVFNATGVMIRDLPITPEKVFMAIKNKK